MVAYTDGHVTKVGCETDFDAFGAEGEADGIGGVVGDGEGLDFDIADAKAATGEKMLGLGKLGELAVGLNSFVNCIAAGAIPGVMRAFVR